MGNKRKWLLVNLFLFAILFLSYLYYNSHFSQKGIFQHVSNRQGYSLHLKEEGVPLEIFIKPDWITFERDERKYLHIVLLENHSSTILLDNVWNRGNDIYFSFHTTFNTNYSHGEFLQNGIFNEDGSYSSSPRHDALMINDKNGNKIIVGQIGYGPGADFSFGIDPQYQDLLKDGFYVKYSGFNLYAYAKN